MFSLLLGIISVLFLILLVYAEEKELLKRFGNDYADYINKTPLLLIKRKMRFLKRCLIRKTLVLRKCIKSISDMESD